MPTGDGGSVPLSQVARLHQVFEDGIIWHRDRLPTITVRADLSDEGWQVSNSRGDRLGKVRRYGVRAAIRF